MPKIVSNQQETFRNIRRFAAAISDSPDLRNRLSYARSWYAFGGDKLGWSFAPAKFAGCVDLDASGYIRSNDGHDGRRVEAALRQWYGEADYGTELYKKLLAELTKFLDAHGKAPSAAVRISVPDSYFEDPLQEDDAADLNDSVVHLMLAVARSLPAGQVEKLKIRLQNCTGREEDF